MKQKKSSKKEWLKSALLIIQVLLACGLLLVTWQTTQLDAEAGGFLQRLAPWWPWNGDGETLPRQSGAQAAAQPASVALWTERGLSAYRLSDDGGAALYERMRPVLAESVGSAETPQSVGEETFAAAVLGKSACVIWNQAIPLPVLAAWLGTDIPDSLGEAGGMSSLFLSAEGEMIRLYYRSSDTGRPMTALTSARSYTLTPLMEEWEATEAFFAASGGEEYEIFQPEQLFLERAPVFPRVKEELISFQPGGEETTALLSAFSFNPYTVRPYVETDGTQVYVEDLATLRLTTDGLLSYTASERTGNTLIEAPEDGNEGERAADRIETARRLIAAVTDGIGMERLSFSSYGYNESQGGWLIQFEAAASGIVIQRPGRAAAAVLIRDGAVVSMELWLSRYTVLEDKDALLPVPQLAAAYAGQSLGGLSIRYLEAEDGIFSADWCRPATGARLSNR